MGLIVQTGFETPTLVDIILDAIRSNQLELNTCMPGIIRSYDPATQTATVQPAFKRTFIDPPEVKSRPEIDDVPVVFPRSGQAGIVFPVNAGDSVLLLFSQRSLDEWLDEGGEIKVNDSRLHNLNDCIAIPGFASLADALDPAPDNATEVRGAKIFVGDKDETTSAITIVGATPPGTLPAAGNYTASPQELNLITIIENFLNVMAVAAYSGPANSGGGGIDSASSTALNDLITDIGKLKP